MIVHQRASTSSWWRRMLELARRWLHGSGAKEEKALPAPAEMPKKKGPDARRLFGALPHGLDSTGVIAAIGNNTGGSGRHAYLTGFGSATRVLIRSLTNRKSGDDPQDYVPEDALILPIVFCARHFIELFLKYAPADIHALRGKKFIAPEHHSIAELWQPFAEACASDRRLRDFPEKLYGAVMAMAELDPTGQTFRYRHDKEGKTHLDDLMVIYVDAFELTFGELFEEVEELYLQIDGLRGEYGHGTYTAALSRADLIDVAERIGAAAKEGKAALKMGQKAIQQDYSLTRSEYACARKVIESNLLLSALTGKERPLSEISDETIVAIVAALKDEPGARSLTIKEMAGISAVLRAGQPYAACEHYEADVKDFLEDHLPTATSDVMRSLRFKPTMFRRGLRKLGQPTLVQQLDTLFPEVQLVALEAQGRKLRAPNADWDFPSKYGDAEAPPGSLPGV